METKFTVYQFKQLVDLIETIYNHPTAMHEDIEYHLEIIEKLQKALQLMEHYNKNR